MTIIRSTPARLRMEAWGYRGATTAELRQETAATPTEVNLVSSFDPYSYASQPPFDSYFLYAKLQGTGFGDFDAAGIPRAGIVTAAYLTGPGRNLVLALEGLSMPVAEFLSVIGSRDTARFQQAFLGGDDVIDGGGYDLYIEANGDWLKGLAGNDTISGHGAHDTIEGGVGDDLIAPTDGQKPSASVVDGGEGIDTVSYAQAASGVEIDLRAGRAGNDTLSGFERAIGSGFADTITGRDAADTLSGGESRDSVAAGAGDDRIHALGDGDTIDGGSGADTVDYAGAGRGLVIRLDGSAGGDDLRSIEQVVGSAFSDTIRGGQAAERIFGGVSASDTIEGGGGADSITGNGYLRGDEGDDSIVGGVGFDDINGNMGNDTCVSGGGDDWVVGGKDNDSLVGSAGQNLVYGNLGADTCDGGAGNDIVRGGQDYDVIFGGAGDDFVSGDRGDDTVTGGLGADLFHTFGDAGVDRVLDFNVAQGDRVLLDPGTQYTVVQSGADTIINMTGGGQMILVGVQMNALTPGWIFGA